MTRFARLIIEKANRGGYTIIRKEASTAGTYYVTEFAGTMTECLCFIRQHMEDKQYDD